MIKAIFFDFNGVIIDDETIQMKAYQEVLAGTRSISLKRVHERAGHGRPDVCEGDV